MSSKVYTIDAIEGNSNLGVPVFSNYGRMQNYQYICLSPTKKEIEPPDPDRDDLPLSNENMQFKIKGREQNTGQDTTVMTTQERIVRLKESLGQIDAGKKKKRPQVSDLAKAKSQNNLAQGEAQSKSMTASAAKPAAHDPFGAIVKQSMHNPPVGWYRPKYSQQDKRLQSTKYYDPKNLGLEQSTRIQQAQFQEKSKLCMCILKALDQTQIQDKKDRELQRSLFQGHKQRRKQEIRRNRESKGSAQQSKRYHDKLDPNSVMAPAAFDGELSNIVLGNSTTREESGVNQTQINSDFPARSLAELQNTMSAGPMLSNDTFETTQHPRAAPQSRPFSQGNSSRFFRGQPKHPAKPLAFKNQQISNTPYHLVKSYPDQAVVKQTDFENEKWENCVSKHVSYEHMQPRGDFVKNQSKLIPNDERFNMSETFDRSTYLTKVRRIQGREFGSYSQRTDKILRQGGDNTWVVDGRTGQYYDQEQKEQFTMQSLKQGPLNFSGYNNRSIHNSIYRRELSLDPHDIKKVDLGYLKTTKNTGRSINVKLEKQTKRDVTKMYKSTEAYANIQRENEKNDYIRKLLTSD